MSTTAKPFENPVIAALETCASRRWRSTEPAVPAPATGASAEARPVPRSPGEGGAAKAEPEPIARTVDIIDAVAAKIEANDFSGIEHAFAAQALALDVIFEQFVRLSVTGTSLYHPAMRMAFKAQSQSRVTFKNLIALKNPHASQNSIKRTIERAKIPV
jgi:hypothetical protein